MRKYGIILFSLLAWAGYAQNSPPPPPGCTVFGVVDTDNDGYAEFDIDWFIHDYYPAYLLAQHGFDFSGYTLQLNINYSGPYTNTVQGSEFVTITFVYSGSGPYYEQLEISAAYYNCFKLQPLSAAGDLDNDGIANAAEDDNHNGNLTDDDSDADWTPNFQDTDLPLSTNPTAAMLFSIAPNPTSGMVAIRLAAKDSSNFEIRLYDWSGRQVFEQQNETLFQTNGLASGMYLLTLTTASGSASQKLIVR